MCQWSVLLRCCFCSEDSLMIILHKKSFCGNNTGINALQLKSFGKTSTKNEDWLNVLSHAVGLISIDRSKSRVWLSEEFENFLNWLLACQDVDGVRDRTHREQSRRDRGLAGDPDLWRACDVKLRDMNVHVDPTDDPSAMQHSWPLVLFFARGRRYGWSCFDLGWSGRQKSDIDLFTGWVQILYNRFYRDSGLTSKFRDTEKKSIAHCHECEQNSDFDVLGVHNQSSIFIAHQDVSAVRQRDKNKAVLDHLPPPGMGSLPFVCEKTQVKVCLFFRQTAVLE